MLLSTLPSELIVCVAIHTGHTRSYNALCCTTQQINAVLSRVKGENQYFTDKILLTPFQLACLDELAAKKECLVPDYDNAYLLYTTFRNHNENCSIDMYEESDISETEYTIRIVNQLLPVDEFSPVWINYTNETSLFKVLKRKDACHLGKVCVLYTSNDICFHCGYRCPCSCGHRIKYKHLSLIWERLTPFLSFKTLELFDTIICKDKVCRKIASMLMQYSRRPKRLIVFKWINPCKVITFPIPIPARHRYKYERECVRGSKVEVGDYELAYTRVRNYAELTVFSTGITVNMETSLSWCNEQTGETLTLNELLPYAKSTQTKNDGHWLFLNPLAELSDPVVCSSVPL